MYEVSSKRTAKRHSKVFAHSQYDKLLLHVYMSTDDDATTDDR